MLQLPPYKDLKLDKLTQVIFNECDKCLDKADVRKAVQQIFIQTQGKAGHDVQRNHEPRDQGTQQKDHAGPA